MRRFLILSLALASSTASVFSQGTWTTFQAPSGFSVCSMLQLTDGSIIMGEDFNGARWFKLTPNQFGSYTSGTFTQLATSPVNRLYYAENILPDGRMINCGGEYVNGSGVWTNLCTIYDPVANTWTNIPPPFGTTGVGDAPAAVLADGRFLLGSAVSNRTAFYNPAANTFTAGPNKIDSGSEEGWVLMPDGTLVNPMGVNSPNAEKYVPSLNQWVPCGTLPVPIFEAASREPGAGLALPDGRMFYTGATTFNVLYTPGNLPTVTGTWTQAPSFPQIAGSNVGCKDSMASLLPNGKIICIAGPVDGVGSHFLAPSYFFEYNPATNSLTQTTSPPTSTSAPFVGRLLVLPTGQLIYSRNNRTLQVYTPSTGVGNDAWRPVVTNAPDVCTPGGTFTMFGTQLNGLSQGSSYGDEGVPATNFPLARLVNQTTGTTTYLRTHDHSTMAIATGSAIHYTRVDVPAAAAPGSYRLYAVANGIPSGVGWPITVAAGASTIQAHVVRQDWTGAIQGQDVQVTINGHTVPISLDKDSNFTLPTTESGSTLVVVKGSHWLAQALPATLSGGVVNLSFTLINGDVDGDNEVGLSDFGVLSAVFGLTSGDPGFDARADLDGDGEVGLSDFGILSGSFGQIGD